MADVYQSSSPSSVLPSPTCTGTWGCCESIYICTDIYLACMVSALTLHEPSSLHALSCAADTDGAKLSAPDAENIYIYVCVYIYIFSCFVLYALSFLALLNRFSQ